MWVWTHWPISQPAVVQRLPSVSPHVVLSGLFVGTHWPVCWLQAEVVHSVSVHCGQSGMSLLCEPPDARTPLSHMASVFLYPPTSSMKLGVMSMLGALTTWTSNSTLQKPGGTAEFAGITMAVFGVKTTSFGKVLLLALAVVMVLPQVFVMVLSPTYATIIPSSVHGRPSGKLELQSRSNLSLLMVRCVPPLTLPVPSV